MVKSFIITVLLLIPLSLLGAQGTPFRGSVINPRQVPISGAQVILKSGDVVVAQVQTESEGVFQIPVASGRYTVEIMADGFKKILRTVNLSSHLPPQSFLMEPAAEGSDPVADMADDDQQMEDYLIDLARPAGKHSGDVVFDLLLAAPEMLESGPAANGTVLDDQGLAVIGADVAVKAGSRTIATVQTDWNGKFNIPVQAGSYTVEVTAIGFDKATQNVNASSDLAPLSFLLKIK